MTRTRLAALTASYNSADTLPQTLASACQDNAIPVLLVDDGSTDGSADYAEKCHGVQVVRQRNFGPSVARNRAILECRAAFVLFLDSDDLLLPGYAQAFEAALAAHPDADVFVCGMQVIDEQGQTVGRHPAPSLQPSAFLSILGGEPVPTNGIIVRREVFARSGLFQPGLNHAEDLDLWLRIAVATDKWVRMDHTLAVYRLRGGSLSKNGKAMWQGICRTVDKAASAPVGPSHLRRSAARRAMARAKAYVYLMAFAPMLRQRARTSIVCALGEVAKLPVRFWPLVLHDGLGSLRRRIQASH